MQIHLKEVWPIKQDRKQIKVISICKGRMCPSVAELAASLAKKSWNAKVLGRAILFCSVWQGSPYLWR